MYFFIFFIFILILMMVSIPKQSNAKRKGIEGEKLVIKKLNKLSKRYIILNDLLINNKNNTAQIDHIVICRKGIFVIETKNYSGKIYGDVKKKYWKQSLNGYKNTFYNPVWQNDAHIRAVRNNLGIMKDIPIYSIVVFCGGCKLKRIRGNKGVIYLKRLNRYIKLFKSDRRISGEEIEKVKHLIEKSNIKSSMKRRQHVKNIKKI